MAKKQKSDPMRVSYAVLSLVKTALTNDLIQISQQMNLDSKIIETCLLALESSIDKLVSPVSRQIDDLS